MGYGSLMDRLMTVNLIEIFIIRSITFSFKYVISWHSESSYVHIRQSKNITAIKNIIKEELDDNIVVHTTSHSPLVTSLLSGLKSPLAVKSLEETISRFVIGNNPRKVHDMKDSSLYWVGTDGSPITINSLSYSTHKANSARWVLISIWKR